MRSLPSCFFVAVLVLSFSAFAHALGNITITPTSPKVDTFLVNTNFELIVELTNPPSSDVALSITPIFGPPTIKITPSVVLFSSSETRKSVFLSQVVYPGRIELTYAVAGSSAEEFSVPPNSVFVAEDISTEVSGFTLGFSVTAVAVAIGVMVGMVYYMGGRRKVPYLPLLDGYRGRRMKMEEFHSPLLQMQDK